MKISLIIPTLNAQAYLPSLLGRLQSQTLRDFELLVIDSESDDRTLEIASSSGARTMTVPRREFNHGRTRNIAAEATSGEYLVFLTQDALPVDDALLSGLAAPLESDGAIAVGYGRQVAHENASAVEKYVRGFNYPAASSTRDVRDVQALGVKAFFCSNACAIYRREVFSLLGGFRNDTIMNEDMEFVYRAVMAGYKVHYAAHAQVLHSHDYSPAQQFRRYVDIGVFFAGNRKLASIARNEEEGRRYLREAVEYLVQNGKARELAHLFLDAAARFLGYRVGINHRALPAGVVKRVSMNKGYWLLHS